MVHRRIAGLALVVTAVGALGGTTPPAQAATAEIRDQLGDAPARYDLGRVSVSHESAGLSMVANVRDLSPKGTQIFIANLTPASGSSYYVTTIRRADGTVVASWCGSARAPRPSGARCRVGGRSAEAGSGSPSRTTAWTRIEGSMSTWRSERGTGRPATRRTGRGRSGSASPEL